MIKKNSQSTLEYILMLVVILVAILAAIAARSPLRTGLSNFFTGLGNKIGGIMDEFPN